MLQYSAGSTYKFVIREVRRFVCSDPCENGMSRNEVLAKCSGTFSNYLGLQRNALEFQSLRCVDELVEQDYERGSGRFHCSSVLEAGWPDSDKPIGSELEKQKIPDTPLGLTAHTCVVRLTKRKYTNQVCGFLLARRRRILRAAVGAYPSFPARATQATTDGCIY